LFVQTRQRSARVLWVTTQPVPTALLPAPPLPLRLS
jgi:hypothetical protein